MEEIFSVNLSSNEINFIRQSLESVTIQGKDAKFLANLQMKLEHELSEIQRIKQEAELKKQNDLQAAIAFENNKNTGKR
jgi:Tfp pilus assembly protein PilN